MKMRNVDRKQLWRCFAAWVVITPKLQLTVSGLFLLLFVNASPAFPQGVTDRNRCAAGYVWREAYSGDRVCVTPETRAQVASDNAKASSRRQPGGAYGPDTCQSGYVWRGIAPTDHVCVTPAIRDQAQLDNAAASARTAYQGDSLKSGHGLQGQSGNFIGSPGTRLQLYNLVMQSDCNLVLYNRRGSAIWAANTAGKGNNCHAEMQPDGNFVVYDAGGRALWASGTDGNPGAFVTVQADGNVVVYAGQRALWSSGTEPVVLTDRCGGDVYISSQYDSPYAPPNYAGHGSYLTRGRGGDAMPYGFTPWMDMNVDNRKIRWWCNSTTGNWADPGTWRVGEGTIEIGCSNNPDGTIESCKPGGSASFASSAVNGWTPERSACPYEVSVVAARLGRDRLLEIRCLR